MSTEPVKDFATDFDHTDEQWSADPYPIWKDLQERCPVAHTTRYGGAWLPTKHEDVSAIARDAEHFSSRSVVVANGRPGEDAPPAPKGLAPPITSDPPFHAHARRLMQPVFSPKSIDALEPFVRETCAALLENLPVSGLVDASTAYAQNIPVAVIARMLGLSQDDGDLFRGFVHDVLDAVDLPEEERFEKLEPMVEYFIAQLEDHIANPKDDLTSFLLTATIEDEPLTPEHIVGSMILLVIAGIDTTWSAIGSSLWHLATHPEEAALLKAEPERLPLAIEEFLRAYAPVTMARLVKEDFEYKGCPMKKDDWVLLPFPAANRDPEVFSDPDAVILDRDANRHAAFGLGAHRCLGSNLARMEIRVALEEWLARTDNFTLDSEKEVLWSHGQVRGPRYLPLLINQ